MKILLVNETEKTELGFSTYTKHLSEELEKIGNEVHQTNFPPGLPVIQSFRNSFHLNDKEYNVLHFLHQGMAVMLNFKKIENSVTTCHDLIGLEADRSIFERAHSKLAVKGMRKSKHIITDSKYNKRKLIEDHKFKDDMISVVYLGVDHNLFKPNKKFKKFIQNKYNIDGKIILFVGSEEPRKNIPKLLEGLSLLKDKYNVDDFYFVKIGVEGWPGSREEILKKINSLKLKNKIIFSNYVPIKDLPKFYNSADVFVFPSIGECIGRPPLEAMACGCTTAASSIKPIREICNNGSLFFNPMNANSIAENIYLALTDKKKSMSVSRKGIKVSKQFTWSKTAKDTLKVYEKILW